jgi:hypothetical protein
MEVMAIKGLVVLPPTMKTTQEGKRKRMQKRPLSRTSRTSPETTDSFVEGRPLPPSTAIGERKMGAPGSPTAVSTKHLTGMHSRQRTLASRLSPYEHLPRPQRSSRTRRQTNTPLHQSVPKGAPSTVSQASSSLVSPANIINATPRPKSPRFPRPQRPNYSAAQMQQHNIDAPLRQATAKAGNLTRTVSNKRGSLRTKYASNASDNSRAKSAPERRRAKSPFQPIILAAQHFQTAMVERGTSAWRGAPAPEQPAQEAPVPWKKPTASGDSVTSATTPSTQASSSPDRSGTRRPQHPRRRPRGSPSPPRRRAATTRERAPTRVRGDAILRGCIQGGLYGGALVGAKMTECLYLSADVYQQECGPHQQRGEDSMFLWRRKSLDEQEDSILDDSAFYSADQPQTADTDSRRSRGRRVTTPPRTPPRRNTAPTKQPHTQPVTDQDPTPTRRTYARHMDTFDVAPHAIRYDQGELHLSRRTPAPWDEAPNEFVELRNLRLQMFEHGGLEEERPRDEGRPQSHPSELTMAARLLREYRSTPLPQPQQQAPQPAVRQIPRQQAQQQQAPQPVVRQIPRQQAQRQQANQQQTAALSPPRHRQEPVAITPPRRQQLPQQPVLSQDPLASESSMKVLTPSRRHQRTSSLDDPLGGTRTPTSTKSLTPTRPHQRTSSLDNPVDGPRSPPEGPSYPPWRRKDLTMNADESLRQELEETKKSLDRAREDLAHAQELAARKLADTAARSNLLTTEKLVVVGKLQEESRAKKSLLEKINQLQEETSNLKANLERTQKESLQVQPKIAVPLGKPPRTPSPVLRKTFSGRSSSSSSTRDRSGLTRAALDSHNHISPDVALADLDDSPSNSLDEETDEGPAGAKACQSNLGATPDASCRKFDGGDVIDMLRGVVGGNDRPTGGPSPVSVMIGPVETPKRVAERLLAATPVHTNRAHDETANDEDTDDDTDDDSHSRFMSSRLIALQSELIDVRSQLAEANAARLAAEHRKTEVESMNADIQRETRKLREEVNELKQLVLSVRSQEHQTEEKFRSEVQHIKKALTTTQVQFEEERNARGKLEDELTDTQNEAEGLRSQVARFMKDLELTKKESERKVRIGDSDAKKLQAEVRHMKEKLAQTNSEIVKQASEHLKKRQEIETELLQTKGTATVLKKRVVQMDDQLSEAESETHNLRIQLNATEEARKRQQGPRAGMFKKRLSDVAGSITRSLSDGMGDGPLSSDGFGDGRIVIGSPSPPRDAQSSTIERLLMGERPHFSDDAGDRKVSPDSPSRSSVLERLRQTLGPAADAGSH